MPKPIVLTGLLAFVVMAAAASLFSPARQAQPPSGQGKAHSTEAARKDEFRSPLTIDRVKAPAVYLNRDRLSAAISRLRIDGTVGLPGLLHAGTVFGWDMPLPGAKREGVQLVDVILNDEISREYFGASLFVGTRHGLQNLVAERNARLHPERQAHWGQLLCEIAKHGIAMNQHLDSTGRWRVQLVLDDAVANFNLEEPQNEWTCVALALLLPPQQSWSNKYREECSFDRMASELMTRNLRGSELSCFGLHILEALVTIARVDQIHPILSESTRQRIRRFLADRVARLQATQGADGSWYVDWGDDPFGTRQVPTFTPADLDLQRTARVHITGHHLAWLLMLADDIPVGDDLFQHGADYLLDGLLQATNAEINERYCPYSHAGHVLQLLVERTP